MFTPYPSLQRSSSAVSRMGMRRKCLHKTTVLNSRDGVARTCFSFFATVFEAEMPPVPTQIMPVYRRPFSEYRFYPILNAPIDWRREVWIRLDIVFASQAFFETSFLVSVKCDPSREHSNTVKPWFTEVGDSREALARGSYLNTWKGEILFFSATTAPILMSLVAFRISLNLVT